LWNVWLALIVIGAAVIVAFKYVFKVSVIKKVRLIGPLAKGKEIIVSLDVRNRSLGEVKDVAVRDSVPSVAEVVERFETIRPTVKRTTTGTALIWKFDALKAGEERVLTYRIKPTVEILGTLRLPAASVMFSTKKHATKTSYSPRAVVGKKR